MASDQKDQEEGLPEAECDSVSVVNLAIPDADLVIKGPISLSAESSLRDEIRDITRAHGLHLIIDQYTFEVLDSKGKFHRLDPNATVEEKLEILAHPMMIKIVNISTPMPTEGASASEFGVTMR